MSTTTDLSKPLFITATTLSALVAGGSLYNTYQTIPALLSGAPSPRTLSAQWRTQVLRGGTLAIPLAGLSGLCSAVLAYTHRHPLEPYRSRNFVIAAALAWAIYPFTFAAILPVNKQLFALAEGYAEERIDDAQAPQVEALVKRWGFLNGIRGLFPLLSTIVAFEAL